MKEVLSEIEASNDIIEILIAPERDFMRISSFGIMGDTHVDVPSNSEYIEVFDCTETQRYRYKVNFIKHSLKALAASSKIALRIADSGVMSIQFLIPIPELAKMAFVEFYVSKCQGATNPYGRFIILFSTFIFLVLSGPRSLSIILQTELNAKNLIY